MLVGSRVYVGTNTGKVIGVDAADGTNQWTFNTTDGPVKGFVFPDRSGTSLYVSTTNKVWGLTDGAATPNWPPVSIASPSIVLFRRSSTLGDGLAGVGTPTLDTANDLVYVGSEAGVVHAVRVPLP